MQVDKNYNSSQIKRDLISVATIGTWAGLIGAGFEVYDQRTAMRVPTELDTLQYDVFKCTKNIEEGKKDTTFINKIFTFFEEQELKIKQEKLEKLTNKKYSGKAVLSKFGKDFVIWGLLGTALIGIGKALRKKGES